MDLLNIKPTSDLIKSRGEGTHTYLYSPHFLYSPHILYPFGFMNGIYPIGELDNLSTSSNILQTNLESNNLDILPIVDNRSIRP